MKYVIKERFHNLARADVSSYAFGMIVREKTKLPDTDFLKVVVDLERKILAMGCELHIDCEEDLVAEGSKHQDCWGANIYPKDGSLEFNSMINIKPNMGYKTMNIEDEEIKRKVERIIRDLLF